jgi:hypothetical protein
VEQTDKDALLLAASIVDKFCDFIHPDFNRRTIFYSKELAKLMREAAKGEYPPFFKVGTDLKGEG